MLPYTPLLPALLRSLCSTRAPGSRGRTPAGRRGPSGAFPGPIQSRAMAGQPSPYSNIEVADQGTVRVVTINRPEKRNCVNSATAAELYDAFQRFNSDDSVRVGVLCGAGGNFCAGYDLSQIAGEEDTEKMKQLMGWKEASVPTAPMGPTRTLLRKPMIAAVSGYAVAGGLELALMCDLRVAEEGAIFGVFNRRFGVPLVDGGTVRLPALIGLSRALDLVLTGRPVSAQEASQMGLANRIVPNGKALDVAMEQANQIVAFPQSSLLADRQSVYYSTFSTKSFISALAREASGGSQAVTEAMDGAKRFVEGEGKSGKF